MSHYQKPVHTGSDLILELELTLHGVDILECFATKQDQNGIGDFLDIFLYLQMDFWGAQFQGNRNFKKTLTFTAGQIDNERIHRKHDTQVKVFLRWCLLFSFLAFSRLFLDRLFLKKVDISVITTASQYQQGTARNQVVADGKGAVVDRVLGVVEAGVVPLEGEAGGVRDADALGLGEDGAAGDAVGVLDTPRERAVALGVGDGEGVLELVAVEGVLVDGEAGQQGVGVGGGGGGLEEEGAGGVAVGPGGAAVRGLDDLGRAGAGGAADVGDVRRKNRDRGEITARSEEDEVGGWDTAAEEDGGRSAGRETRPVVKQP